MRQLKLFFMLLLSLAGMSAVAQKKPVLDEGYYYMKSGIDGDGVWMTSLRNVVPLVSEARNFWSVWHVEYVEGSDNVYTFRNVGNQYVMTPAKDPTDTELKTDEGYLYYDKKLKSYLVGDATGDPNKVTNMKLVKQRTGDSYTVQPEDVVNYYMAVDNGIGTDESGNKMSSDQTMKSIKPVSVSLAAYCKWNFDRIALDGVKNLYVQGVQDLNGYVGGLTTMEIPDVNLEELNPVKAIVAKYKEDMTTLSEDVVDAAKKYKAYIEKINAMRNESAAAVFCQNLVEGRPFWVETIGSRGGYKHRMQAQGTDKWEISAGKDDVTKDTPEGTFYVKSFIGKGKGNGKVIDPKTGKTTPYDNYYVMKNGKGKYLYAGDVYMYDYVYSIVGKSWEEWSSNGWYQNDIINRNRKVVKQTDKDNEALQFTILPIIPGVYQISQIAVGWQGDPYLTNSGKAIDSYRMAESYSYFKFKTYTAFDYTVSQAGSDVVGSYGNILHTKIDEHGLNAYYIRGGKYAYNDDNTVKGKGETPANQMTNNDWGVDWDETTGKMTVYLDKIPTVNGANVIQWMQGVILLSDKKDGQAIVPAGKKEGQWYSEEIVEGSAQDIADNNMLHIAANTMKIEEDTWTNYFKYFVLAYKPKTDTPIGYWHKEPVYGCGLGFYHVQRGSHIPTGKCYLATKDIDWQLNKRYGEKWNERNLIPYPDNTAASNSRAAAPAETEENVVAGVSLVFRDCNGVVAGIEEAPVIDIEEDDLEALTTLYSLDGKKVTAPKSGEIYILNGKKVMF